MMSRRHRLAAAIVASFDFFEMMEKTYGQKLKKVKVSKLPEEYKEKCKSEAKACWNNAFVSATKIPGAEYVIGWTVTQGIPIEHAWVKQGGTYYDPTIELALQRDPTKDDYYVLDEMGLGKTLKVMEHNKIKSPPMLHEGIRWKRKGQ